MSRVAGSYPASRAQTRTTCRERRPLSVMGVITILLTLLVTSVPLFIRHFADAIDV